MEIKKTSINLPVDLHRRFKSTCSETGISITDAIISAILEWIERNYRGDVDKTIKSTYIGDLRVSGPEFNAVQRLIAVLRSGHADAAAGIMTAVEAFDALSESNTSKRSQKKGTGSHPSVDTTHSPMPGHSKP